MPPTSKTWDDFLRALHTLLSRSPAVRTSWGDFIVRTEKGMVGRNPVTGQEIRTVGKYFYYFLPSAFLLQEVFALKEADLTASVEQNQAAELDRLAQRFDEFVPEKALPQLEIPTDLTRLLTTTLKTDGRIALEESSGLFKGEMKASRKFYPALIFSAVGKILS